MSGAGWAPDPQTMKFYDLKRRKSKSADKENLECEAESSPRLRSFSSSSTKLQRPEARGEARGEATGEARGEPAPGEPRF